MATKYYAIKKGLNAKTGEAVSNIIVGSWNECLSYVKGVKGAIYKSFTSESEAIAYLNSENGLKKGEDSYPEDIPHIYVDGSYNSVTDKFGYGLVVILNNEIIHVDYGSGEDKECNQRQVNGELKAAIEGIKYSLSKGYDEVVLFYDYAGVCNHALGTWERNSRLAREYYETMNTFMKDKNIKINFVKVDSHTDDLFNDMADEFAKTGAELSFISAVDKALASTTVKVLSQDIKKALSLIINKNLNKVICDNDLKFEAIDSIIEENPEEKIEDIINYIKALSGDKKIKYIKSLKKDIQTKIIISLL